MPREARDRARQIVEDVGVPHEQVAGIVGGRREQVAQPEARRLRRADRVAARAERRRDLDRIAHDHDRRRDRRHRAPERQQQREPRILPGDHRRPLRGAARTSRRGSRAARARNGAEARRRAPSPDRARAAGPTRRRDARAARRRAARSTGSRSSPSGCRVRAAACRSGSPSETPRKRSAPAMNDVPLRCMPVTHTALDVEGRRSSGRRGHDVEIGARHRIAARPPATVPRALLACHEREPGVARSCRGSARRRTPVTSPPDRARGVHARLDLDVRARRRCAAPRRAASPP